MNLVGDDVRSLNFGMGKDVRDSLRRLLQFRVSRREKWFRRNLSPFEAEREAVRTTALSFALWLRNTSLVKVSSLIIRVSSALGFRRAALYSFFANAVEADFAR